MSWRRTKMIDLIVGLLLMCISLEDYKGGV